MKFLIFATFLFNIHQIKAEEIACDIDYSISTEATNLATTFDPKHCLDIKKLKRTKLANAFVNEADREEVCADCRSKLGKVRAVTKEYKNEFKKAIFNELRKSLSQTMFELMTLRSSRAIKFDPTNAVSACRVDEIIKEEDGACFLENKAEITEIQKELANEFSNIVSLNTEKESLLEKYSIPGCLISDKEVIFSQNRYVEEYLPSILNALKSMGTFDSKLTISEQLNNYLVANDINIALDSIQSHPLINNILSSKEYARSFLNKAPTSNKIEDLRSYLYSDENASEWAKKLTSKCSNHFKMVKESLCSKELVDGNFAVDTKASVEAVKGIEITLNPVDHDKKVEALITFCKDMDEKDKNPLLFSRIKNTLNNDLNSVQKDKPFNQYKVESYKTVLGSPKEMLCSISKDPSKCIPDTATCSMYNHYLETKKPDSKTKNILAAHDENIDKILRSLIGEPKNISDDTRRTLVAEGILKTTDGTYITKDAPERKADYYQSESSPASFSQTSSSESNSKATVGPPKSSQQQAQAPVVAGFTADTKTVSSVPETAPVEDLEESVEEDLKRKIKERLENQAKRKDIEQVVAEPYNKNRKTPLTPQQVTAKTQEILEEIDNDIQSGSASMPTVGGRASVSRDKEKETKEQKEKSFLNALYPNAVAGNLAKNPEKDTDEKLNVITVDSPQDIKIVVDDIKNLKGQEIKKLIQSEKPFILKVANQAYKIDFKKTERNRQPAEVRIIVTPKQKSIENYFTNLMNAKPQNGSDTYANLKEAVKTNQGR